MENTSNSDEWKALVGIAILITFFSFYFGIKYYGSLQEFMDVLDNLFNFSYNLLNFNFNSFWGHSFLFLLILKVFIAILVLCGISFFILLLYSIIKSAIINLRLIKKETIEIEDLLETEVELDEQKLKLLIEKLRFKLTICRTSRKLKKFILKLKKRIKTCLELLERIKIKDLEEITRKKIEQNERRIQDLDEEKRIKETYFESDYDVIVSELRTYENKVFKKSRLSEEQVKALEYDGYKQVNEYSLVEHKYSRYLVKSPSNHSPTHTFLVWDAMRLLWEVKGITNIQEHETVDADITFTFNKKKYALEIEKGDLLRKKDQQKEKVAELNKKYPKRWMFIVSNKNLLPKYQKLGFSTQRSRVAENLRKMLEK